MKNTSSKDESHISSMRKYAEETLNYHDFNKGYDSCIALAEQGYYRIIYKLMNTLNPDQYQSDLVVIHCMVNKDNLERGNYAIIKMDVMEYIYDPRNEVIIRLLNNYVKETCPLFVFEDYTFVETGNIMHIASRELPSSLSYLPGLISGLGETILTLIISTTIAVYVHSKHSNKNIFVFRIVSFMYIAPLIIASILNTLLKLMCIDILDSIILNRIKSIFSKLQDNKANLVNNLDYILEKVKEV